MQPREMLFTQLRTLCPDVDPDRLTSVLQEYDIEERSIIDSHDVKAKIDLYLANARLEGMADSTSKNYRNELLKFANQTQKLVEQIRTGDVRAYLAQFGKLKVSTVTTKLNILKSFFGWMHKEEIISRDPCLKIKTPKQEKRIPKALTQEELEMVRECCQTPRERALVECFYATGARLSEVVRLNISDIDFERGCTKVFGKGSKERTVFFSIKARIHLKKYLNSRFDKCPALFVTERKKPNGEYGRLGNRAIEDQIKKIASRSELTKNLHPHIFRHTFATTMLNNGADLVSVQNLLGHTDPATTLIYAVLTEQTKEAAYKKYLIQ